MTRLQGLGVNKNLIAVLFNNIFDKFSAKDIFLCPNYRGGRIIADAHILALPTSAISSVYTFNF